MLRQLTEGVVNPGRVGVLVEINLKDANGSSFMGKLDGGYYLRYWRPRTGARLLGSHSSENRFIKQPHQISRGGLYAAVKKHGVTSELSAV